MGRGGGGRRDEGVAKSCRQARAESKRSSHDESLRAVSMRKRSIAVCVCRVDAINSINRPHFFVVHGSSFLFRLVVSKKPGAEAAGRKTRALPQRSACLREERKQELEHGSASSLAQKHFFYGSVAPAPLSSLEENEDHASSVRDCCVHGLLRTSRDRHKYYGAIKCFGNTQYESNKSLPETLLCIQKLEESLLRHLLKFVPYGIPSMVLTS